MHPFGTSMKPTKTVTGWLPDTSDSFQLRFFLFFSFFFLYWDHFLNAIQTVHQILHSKGNLNHLRAIETRQPSYSCYSFSKAQAHRLKRSISQPWYQHIDCSWNVNDICCFFQRHSPPLVLPRWNANDAVKENGRQFHDRIHSRKSTYSGLS